MTDEDNATRPHEGSDSHALGKARAAIHVVAGSGPVKADRLARGLAHIRRRCGEPTQAPNLATRTGYFAGDDATRLATLDAAFRDAQARVVWAARGGYGLTRLLRRLDPAPLRERPKLLVGFSDVTALLCWAWTQAGLMGVHGPVVGQLGELPPDDLERLWTLLEGELPEPLVAGEDGQPCTTLGAGRVEGRLFPANLEILRTLIGTPWLPDLRGAIVAVEEIGERPYRLDRALTHLLESGALRGVAGVAVGQLHACVEPENGGSKGWSAEEVIEDRFGRLGVPVLTGLPFGHAPKRNAALPFGAPARLDLEGASLEILEWSPPAALSQS
ncbi:hypothetical protein PPSIR1_35962 [Plesiocystis pacifica SIR-1]|uniref:Muramoyltetrapeptide carboxypeptidase n=1 Tax=Plesiocystis pacifica SIR-1 TaxID=391625 RepID=A6G1X1_9BACT|nr:LD-carboxypeptidase [Plesiocystis pacifica]EDM80161.1 hypothetical protein PPSIR1_35962 [Plesiocystis pacifica SIR-1]